MPQEVTDILMYYNFKENENQFFLELGQLREGDAAFRYEDPKGGAGWLLFSQPAKILQTAELTEVGNVLEQAESHTLNGGFAAGFLAYEAGAAFDAKLPSTKPEWPVLAWFALFDSAPSFYRELAPCYRTDPLAKPQPDLRYEDYLNAFEQVKIALSEGRNYQTNLTFPLRWKEDSPPSEFFALRCGVAPAPYAAYLHGGSWTVASFSPELFFSRTGDLARMKPMKGTAPKEATRKETERAALALVADPKTIAENLMIVDMVRNDLGRVARTGSVATPEMLAVEWHEGILQVTSTVEAKVDCSIAELMRAIFPPASVTGAPKVSTCEIIARLEGGPRGVYCGAIGMMGPDRCARFSVAIRTALLQNGQGVYGVGSGLVWDSEAPAEYAECLLKAEALCKPARQWELVDAIRVSALDDPQELQEHFDRLGGSAAYFKIPLDLAALRRALADLPPGAAGPKIKLSVRRDGAFRVEVGPSLSQASSMRAALAPKPTSSADPSLRHKTNSRAFYEACHEMAIDFDEVLFFNERNEVTEFRRGAALFRIDGRLTTPPPEAGCLPSIGAKRMAKRGELVYATVTVSEALRADEVFFLNAIVDGPIPVTLCPSQARVT